MTIRFLTCSLFAAAGLVAQGTAVYPADYAQVAEGPFNSPNLPLANGTGRALVVYEQWDLPVPVGAHITRLAFRQDATLTAMDTGRSLQLEIRMGYTANGSANLSTTLDANYAGAPVTVFGPAVLQLPNLRDASNPLPNGRVAIDLVTPFHYQPGSNNLLVEYRIFGNSGGGTSFNYRLDRADFHSPVADGVAGCQHSGAGTPTLALSPVRCGGQFSATVANGPGSSFAVLALTPGLPLVTPFPISTLVPGVSPTCLGQITLAGAQTLTAFTSGSGGATFSFTVPNARVPFNDMFLGAQAAFFDVFAPGGLAVSNGSQVQIGIQPQSSVLWGAGPPAVVTTGVTNLRYCPVAYFDWQ